jgi:DNA-binding FrmR family transcriptional regulator
MGSIKFTNSQYRQNTLSFVRLSGYTHLTIYPTGVYIGVMDSAVRKKADVRLARIEGQVKGIRNMVESGRYCVDILLQLSAVISALKKVEDLVMENHLNTCVVDALKSEDEEQRKEKIKEVVDVMATFRRQ